MAGRKIALFRDVAGQMCYEETIMKDGNKDIAIELFDRIREAFPSLAMNLDPDPGDVVELSLDIPAQDGLDFWIGLNLQNEDELHLSAGELWASWFPCDDEPVREKYYLAVTGLLSGQNRIVEHMRGKRCVKAELQELKHERAVSAIASMSWN